jgi:TRAP-type mannitol/chloroaromatic compound transport system permease small subunit
VTLRIKGTYTVIKHFLEGSSSDLLTAWLGIKRAIVDQINKIHRFAIVLYSKVLMDVEWSMYNQVYRIITILVIRLVEYQQRKIMSLLLLLRPCTRT